MRPIVATERKLAEFFPGVGGDFPSWQEILSALNTELLEQRALVFPNLAFGLYYVDYCEKINQLKHLMAAAHPNDPGVDCHIYVSLLQKAIGLGTHKDDQDVYTFQAHGESIWRIFSERIQGEHVDYHLKTGDALYVPAGINHRVITVLPRVNLSIGVLNPGQKEFPGSK